MIWSTEVAIVPAVLVIQPLFTVMGLSSPVGELPVMVYAA